MSESYPLKPTKSGSNAVSLLSCSICLGAFIFAYNTVCLTQIAQLFKNKNQLTKQQFVTQLSIATSAFNLGGFISPIFYKKFVSIFGELKGLLIVDVLSICVIIVELIQLEFYILASSRLCLGLLVGLSSAIMPAFVNSIAPLQKIGKLGSFNQLLQTCALVVGYTAGYIIHDNDVKDQIRWRIYLGLPIIVIILRIISLQFIFRFQTLQRHIKNNQIEQLKRYCLMVYGDDSQQAIQAVKQLKSFTKLQNQNKQTFKIRFIVALTVIAANQFSGTNAINYYAKQLFNKITDGKMQFSQILIILMSLFQVLGMLYSTLIIDIIGRKNLILRGQLLIGIFLFCIIIFDKVMIPIFGHNIGNIGIIVLIFMHLFTMNVTMGPCCAIYATQIIQDITWAIFLMKGMTFLIAFTTQYMIEYIGVGFMFLIFFGLTVITHLFLRRNIKQTKGKSTAQIYSSFKTINNNNKINQEQNNKNDTNKQSLLSDQKIK